MSRNRRALALPNLAKAALSRRVCLKGASVISLVLLFSLAVFSAAFAGGNKGHGNGVGNGVGNGGGNGGAGNGNSASVNSGAAWGNGGGAGLSTSGGGVDKSETAKALGQTLNDKTDDKEKWLDQKPVGLGNVDENLNEYVKHLDSGLGLDPSVGLGKSPHEKKVKDHEPNGKAIGWRRKEAAENAGQMSAENGPPSPGPQASIDPRSYSRREVLAVDLSPSGVVRAQALGFTVGAPSPGTSDGALIVLTTPQGVDALDAMATLRSDLPAERIYLNRLYRFYHPATKHEDSAQPEQPAAPGGARKCHDDRCYPQAAIQWKDSLAACVSETPIGVIDTDVDLGHPAFAGQRITHQSFLPEGRRNSANWHGTGVLALLAGRPDSGTPGLIPNATFFVGSIFFIGDDGDAVTDTVSLLRAFGWMGASGVRLINMSFAGPSDELMQVRIEKMSAQGFVFTAAAGNEGPAAGPSYPAAYPQVIAVTAVSKDMRVYPSANRGAYIDLAAPGVRIWTAAPEAREGYRAGTSFATPFATAVLALLQPDVLRQPKAEVLRQVQTRNLGASNSNQTFGRGLVQAPGKCPVGGSVAYRQPPASASSR